MAGDEGKRAWCVRMAPDVAAGLITAFVVLALSGSYSLLIFSGPLQAYSGLGLYVSLVTAVVVGLFTAFFGGHPGLLSIPQDRIAPILGFLSASLAAAIPASAGAGTLLATVLASIALAALTTGLGIWLLGTLRMGNFVRFIPYPVIGGFLAGSGWLLATGSVKAVTGIPLTLDNLERLLGGGAILPWVPSAVFGAALFVAQMRLRHWAVLPSFVVGGLAGFFVGLGVAGMGAEEGRAAGWLIPGLGSREPIPFSPWEMGGLVSWWELVKQSGTFLAIAITSVVSILLNCSAVEAESAVEIDFNRELRATGMANLLAGAVGGMPGFSSMSLSRLAGEAGAKTRLAGIVSAAACGLVLVWKPEVVGWVPKFILGGLLFFLGLRFLHEWVVEAWSRLPRPDFAAILLILAVVGVFGYLEGVMVGLLTATILFVVNYSRVQVVTQSLNGSEQRSNVDRPAAHQRVLGERGKEVEIFKLQGFLFFGSANSLLSQIRERLRRKDLQRLRYVVLDLRRVHGIDSSAVLALRKLRRHAGADGFTLILCSVAPGIQDHLAGAGFEMAEGSDFRLIADRDHALEWCEDRLLAEAGVAVVEGAELVGGVDGLWPEGGPRFEEMLEFVERQEVKAGEFIMLQGDPAEEMFLLERGRVTAVLELQNGKQVRLRSMTAGSVIGELGIFLREKRTASVVADGPCVLHRLTTDSLARMGREKPAVAAAFHQFMIRMLAERLVRANKTLQAVLE